MYVGAAVCLWLVRAWKVGDLERNAAILQAGSRSVDPMAVGMDEATATVDKKTSPFLERLFVWQKV